MNHALMVDLNTRLSQALGAPVQLELARVPSGIGFREFADTLRPGNGQSSVSYALPWVAVLASSGCAAVGVDIEPLDRPVDPGIARFVLAPGESDADLLTLWTLKEAAYKADPSSRDFTEYTTSPGRCLTPAGQTLRTTTLTHNDLRISVAVCPHPKETDEPD